MSGDKAFVDTNVFAYLFSEDEPIKQQRSIWAINTYECHVNTQVLNEFCNICTRKWKLQAIDVMRALDKICAYCTLWSVDLSVVRQSVRLYEKYHYSYYDCLMISSALDCGCETLLTEDLTDGSSSKANWL